MLRLSFIPNNLIPKYYVMNPIMLPNLSNAEVVCKWTCLSCIRGEVCKRDFEWILGS